MTITSLTELCFYRQQSKKLSCKTTEHATVTPLQWEKRHFRRDTWFRRGSVNLNILMRAISLPLAYCSQRGSGNALGIQVTSPLLKKHACKVILFVLIDHCLNCNTFQSKIFHSKTLCQTLI